MGGSPATNERGWVAVALSLLQRLAFRPDREATGKGELHTGVVATSLDRGKGKAAVREHFGSSKEMDG